MILIELHYIIPPMYYNKICSSGFVLNARDTGKFLHTAIYLCMKEYFWTASLMWKTLYGKTIFSMACTFIFIGMSEGVLFWRADVSVSIVVLHDGKWAIPSHEQFPHFLQTLLVTKGSPIPKGECCSPTREDKWRPLQFPIVHFINWRDQLDVLHDIN